MSAEYIVKYSASMILAEWKIKNALWYWHSEERYELNEKHPSKILAEWKRRSSALHNRDPSSASHPLSLSWAGLQARHGRPKLPHKKNKKNRKYCEIFFLQMQGCPVQTKHTGMVGQYWYERPANRVINKQPKTLPIYLKEKNNKLIYIYNSATTHFNKKTQQILTIA